MVLAKLLTFLLLIEIWSRIILQTKAELKVKQLRNPHRIIRHDKVEKKRFTAATECFGEYHLSLESSSSLGIPRALDRERGLQHRHVDAGRGRELVDDFANALAFTRRPNAGIRISTLRARKLDQGSNVMVIGCLQSIDITTSNIANIPELRASPGETSSPEVHH